MLPGSHCSPDASHDAVSIQQLDVGLQSLCYGTQSPPRSLERIEAGRFPWSIDGKTGVSCASSDVALQISDQSYAPRNYALLIPGGRHGSPSAGRDVASRDSYHFTGRSADDGSGASGGEAAEHAAPEWCGGTSSLAAAHVTPADVAHLSALARRLPGGFGAFV